MSSTAEVAEKQQEQIVEEQEQELSPEALQKKLDKEEKKRQKQLEKEEKQKKKEAAAAARTSQAQKKSNEAVSATIGIQAKKEEDFSNWYQQVVSRSELIDYYDISGCYILRPWSYEIWEYIQQFLDAEFKKLGVKNSYFPMFVPKKNLECEKAHVEGFSAEVAWVTKSGNQELDEHIAVRPTSETVMYPAVAKWIHSHRDLPMKLNQWCNVVRWEFKDPTPFIRSREFLWQEGHTIHATTEEADKEVRQILDIYERAYEEILACSVVKGTKTEYEKFAGGSYTTTVESYIPGNGRAVQAATSHALGQNFSKMFDISYLGEDGEKHLAWQNSWGFTTRSIGVMIMSHSDNKGLVLPPRVAPIQVVFIPIYKGENRDAIAASIQSVADTVRAANPNIRIHVDDRANVTPGFKYNHWELKGVPLRIELGERDIEKQNVVIARRHTGIKTIHSWENLAQTIVTELDVMQNDLRVAAKTAHNNAIVTVRDWNGFMTALQQNQLPLLPWCGDEECETNIKKQSAEDSKDFGGDRVGAAKSLCIPFAQPEGDITQEVCAKCAKKAITWVLFGRSY